MNTNKIDNYKLFLFFLIVISYFVGFIFRENSAGGAEQDFLNFTWPAIQGFKKDFFYAIKNYGQYGEGSWPMFHVVNSLLNPFTNSKIGFQFSITILSLLNVFIFKKIIDKKFNLKQIDSLLISSTLLLLPIFRSSAFWGLTENFGWLFLLLSIYFFLNLKDKNLSVKIKKDDLINIFLICFFSSVALYTRPYLIFFPIYYLSYLLIIKKNNQLIFYSILFYVLMSVPGLALIDIWGGLYDVKNRSDSLLLKYLNPENSFRNLPVIASLIAFYYAPFLFIEIIGNFRNVIKKYYMSFIFFATLLIILTLFGILNPLKNILIGGGVVLKMDYIFFGKNLIFFSIISALGFSILFKTLIDDFKNNAILIFPFLIIYSLPYIILQEYFEPLILFLFFLLISFKAINLSKKNTNTYIAVFSTFFITYLAGSVFFKHFAFRDIDQWRFFLNSL